MTNQNQFLVEALDAYQKKGLMRSLTNRAGNCIDFDSNDFLGLAINEELKEIVLRDLSKQSHQYLFGSTGSRLVSGNLPILEETEQWLAHFFKSEDAILCKSGFEANHSFFGYVPQRTDTIIYDAEIHASIKTTARLSGATCLSFRHNDTDNLQLKAKSTKGRVFVAVESIYSISGDVAPLKNLADICRKNNWLLVVDEAHTTGIAGNYGEGLCCELGIEKDIFARIHTFGKAAGCSGAVIVGNQSLKSYLLNFAIPAIYSTAMPPAQAIAIKNHLSFIQNNPELKANLQLNMDAFNSSFCDYFTVKKQHIIPLEAGNREETIRIVQTLGKLNIALKAMLPPTTSGNKSLIRITLHSNNSFSEIDYFFSQLRKLL